MTTDTLVSTGGCCPQFQALSDRTRVRILELLRDGERCVCELMADLKIRQSLLSFHLKTLKNARLVKDRKDGRWVHYSINWSGLEELRQLISVLQTPQPRKACCGTPDNEPCGCGNSLPVGERSKRRERQ